MYSNEYIQFLTHFHGDRDYFECHEILEEYWKKVAKGDKSSVWVGLILMAVANYHHRRNNFSGAHRTLEKSLKILEIRKNELAQLGLDSFKLIKILSEHLELITSNKPYKSYNLPITDELLQAVCEKECKRKGFIWCNKSDLTNEFLINKHRFRDRSSVIKEREIAMINRKKKGSE
ncbi:DUF309 domain-containing protein [Bacillus methanolicus]|uniref:DUF309 domain-containing protein n=1 Tax=Bacillus methanolicus (strain MGA3 / ATCC 53907) TaxID=796606 RepID=I3EA41_BACMM|nr:DUF309 domain-containing protein [Bacillus methanolicus]AIE60604.1 hypothetical protein BMMGA3_11040 [Bacillus methanolicus MGA3]EIJ83362.1 hypothetical protein MGA3_09080 [Bacillus methanolicus MGA3]